MRAELRSIRSPDVELTTFRPEHDELFSIYVEAMIGPAGDAGEERFGFTVCSAGWLAAQVSGARFHWGRGCLVIARAELSTIDLAVRHLCGMVKGETWPELAGQLAHFTFWEFGDEV